MADTSLSVQWRLKGNSFYKSVTDHVSPVIKISRYQEALTCYERAVSLTTLDDEVSSAAKNYGLTSWKLGQLASNSCEQWLVIKRYFKNALRHFNLAYIRGSGNKTEEWRDNVLAHLRGCWEDVGSETDDLPEIDQGDRIITIRECIDYIPCPDMKADCFMELADYHFHHGVKAIASGDYKVCLTNMRDCYHPLAEAIRYGRNIDRICREHGTMEKDVITHLAVAESSQSREIGDKLLDKVLLDEETLNVDMVWEVIDWYKDAILKVRDLDMKLEAIALSRIGVVYDKVFKVKFRAKIYFNKAIELAHAMTPITFTNEDWYKKCTETLKRYQEETVQHEQEEETKAKAEVLKKLKPVLDEIDKHSDDKAVDFLKFIYKKYPRKNPAHKLAKIKGEVTFDQRYKMLQKAVIHFHPDRVKVDEEGLEAKVLSEEITKRLTARYENIKSQK